MFCTVGFNPGNYVWDRICGPLAVSHHTNIAGARIFRRVECFSEYSQMPLHLALSCFIHRWVIRSLVAIAMMMSLNLKAFWADWSTSCWTVA